MNVICPGAPNKSFCQNSSGNIMAMKKNNKSGAFLKYFPCLLVSFHLLRTLSRNVRSSASQQGTGDVSLPETIKHTDTYNNLLSGRGQALDLSLQYGGGGGVGGGESCELQWCRSEEGNDGGRLSRHRYIYTLLRRSISTTKGKISQPN